MKQPWWRQLLPHVIAYVVCLVIALGFFAPAVLENKALRRQDHLNSLGMQGEIKKYREKGDEILWTNSMFSGMPVYQITMPASANYAAYLGRFMLLGHGMDQPQWVILLSMLTAYLMLIILGCDWRVALTGAIGYGFSTYMIDLAEAGHSTKMYALSFAPLMIGGAILTYKGKYLLGASLFGLFTSLNLYANHFQISYYLIIILAILGVAQLVSTIFQKDWKNFLVASALLILAGGLGAASNLQRILTTREYAEETTRGVSELKQTAAKEGLSKDYAFQWSYGIGESLTFLVPNAKGGGASQNMSHTETYQRVVPGYIEQLTQQGYPYDVAEDQASRGISSWFYFGDQPFVGTPIYMGVIILLLAFLGAFLVQGATKWWLVISTLLMISFAWGKNFGFNSFLFDSVPGFNKFRAVSMALGLAQLGAITLAALGFQQLISKGATTPQKLKALYYSLGSMAVLALMALFAGNTGPNDTDIMRMVGEDVIAMIRSDRSSLVKSDVTRAFIYLLIIGGLLFAFLKGALKGSIAVLLVTILTVVDFWTVNHRYIYADKFVDAETAASPPKMNAADSLLQKDPDPHFRVFDLTTGDPFQNANASFYHKSIGGYHAAKLGRYRDMIEKYFKTPNPPLHLLGMLNGKYNIVPGPKGIVPQPNPMAAGNAWFVKRLDIVPDVDTELDSIGRFDHRTTAILSKPYAKGLEGFTPSADSTASIRLTRYHPDTLRYSYTAGSEQFAVFSEVYYPPAKGWEVYLDGKLIPEGFTKVDYLLRGMKLPAGNHKLEMIFAPKSFATGSTVGHLASILLLLAAAAGLVLHFKNSGIGNAAHIDELEPSPTPATTDTPKTKK